jgi:hypothetical protein
MQVRNDIQLVHRPLRVLDTDFLEQRS